MMVVKWWKIAAGTSVAGLLCLGLLFGCQKDRRIGTDVDAWLEDSARPRVLSTIGMIDDLVREIGGETVARLTLIHNGLDPHSYELVKGDDEKLQTADIIFCNGLGLEHGASLARYLQASDRVVAIGESIVAGQPDAIVRINGQVDPHIWTDVALWLQGTRAIEEALSRLQPLHAATYAKKGEELRERLHKLDRTVREEMELVPLERRYLVTSHDSFNYFARSYLATGEERASDTWRERCTAPEGLSPDGELSTSDIQNVITHLSNYGVEVLFPESNLNQDAIRKIVEAGRRRGLEVRIAQEALYADAMGEAGSQGDTYEKMMLYNARTIAKSLKGQS